MQSGFFALVIYLGYLLGRFIQYYKSGGAGIRIEHPDGVEAFLPIGALTSLKYWIVSGSIHPIHPAAVIIFVAILTVSLILKKGFCGWICPVGALSEQLYRPWKKQFRKNVRLPRFPDLILRSLKYLLLAFFFWAIVIGMSQDSLQMFLDGDYWKISDVKMYVFFSNITLLSFVVILALVLLSIPMRNFWCRYLCPYGALLGLIGFLSPLRITRSESLCTNCKKCTRHCPYHLPVDVKPRIISPECNTCLVCLSGCPDGALTLATPRRLFSLPAKLYPLILAILFFGIILLGKITGNWKTGVTDRDYQRLIPNIERLEHP